MTNLTFNTKLFNELLEKQKLDAKEFSHQVGVSPALIERWKKGEAIPHASLINKISKQLGVSGSALFSVDGNFKETEVSAAKAEEPKKSTPQTPTIPENDKKKWEPPAIEEIKAAMPLPVTNEKVEKAQPEASVEKSNKRSEMPKNTSVDSRAKKSVASMQKAVKTAKNNARADVLNAMKSTRFATKSVAKDIDSTTAKVWTGGLIQSYKESVDKMFTQLEDMLNASYPAVFGQQENVDGKYKELLDAAKKSSDKGISIAIDILKQFEKK